MCAKTNLPSDAANPLNRFIQLIYLYDNMYLGDIMGNISECKSYLDLYNTFPFFSEMRKSVKNYLILLQNIIGI